MSTANMSVAQSQSLSQFEHQLIQTYQDQNFFEVNNDIENEIRLKIENMPSSFQYPFSKLQHAGYVHLDYSPDRKLKFYTFDVSGGGTMGQWSNHVQYQTDNQLKLDAFKAGRILKIYQANIAQKTIYLVESYYKGDSCHGTYHLRAVEIGSKQLLKSYVFKSKSKTNHEIEVEFDCNHIDRSKLPKFFRITPKTVDVMLLNQESKPQNKYLRYTLRQNGFIYSGIVK
ncbi:hypothetical protein [Acinetobacter shaoyimingii]|uniref:Uncharacterized protein n=1 Tax=Acinetobacter shaoyimingii TaxID=2715164 RepID=A0A6G8RYM7_9GAMM|nr:hypothetical protein [Acinetobacter shaoyimingii]QIO07056.1 hypothetical protein G8E00_14490 [Acinetobacter shaoyimingii]